MISFAKKIFLFSDINKKETHIKDYFFTFAGTKKLVFL